MTSLVSLVDRIGSIDTAIKKLKAERKDFADELAEHGDGVHKGKIFSALVSTFDRVTLPMKVAKAKLKALGVSRRWFHDHEETEQITRVTVDPLGS